MGRRRGTQSFTIEDSITFLGIAAEILPVTARAWEEVAQCYNEEYAIHNRRAPRDGLSLSRQYLAILTIGKPTESASKCAMIAVAMRLRDALLAKVGVSTGPPLSPSPT